MPNKIEIVMLGSGSSVPTAKRNHPGILLKYKEENCLFDCGEGIQRQFRKANENPCKITRLFISHWHGDHILGIPGLLQTLYLNAYGKTLEIYGPRRTKNYMDKILGLFAYKGKIYFNVHEISKGIFINDKDFYVEAFPMSHGIPSLAYSFYIKDSLRIDKNKLKKLNLHKNDLKKLKELKKGKDIILSGKKIKAKDVTYVEKGRKIAFVFDTLMNENILKIAKDSDILFCESTYFDEKELAMEHKHLNVFQVADIAKKSKVKKLVLFHLSQRYEMKEKDFLNEAKKKIKDVIIAEDLMRFEV
ncbi:MAG: ribonuclease Z [Candidatus Pacearchaeota archaeon]